MATDAARNDEEKPWPSSGLQVLVVDESPLYLLLMESLLLQSYHKVTTCRQASDAISLVNRYGESIDLIISDVLLPNEDGLLILKTLADSQLDVPLIMMSWSKDINMMMKCIEHGACDFLIKPVTLKEIDNIWLHVFRQRILKQGKIDDLMRDSFDVEDVGVYDDDVPCIKLEAADDIVTDIRHLKRTRLHWTRQLHHQFLAAVNALGLNKATPKKVLEIMKVQNLTREQVASHLQKYRMYKMKNSNSVPAPMLETSRSDVAEVSVPQIPTSLGHLQVQEMLMRSCSNNGGAGESSTGSHYIHRDMNSCLDDGLQDSKWGSWKEDVSEPWFWN